MDTVKSWMDVEEIRKMAAALLEEPSDLEALEQDADAAESQSAPSATGARERALKAISEAANRLNQPKEKREKEEVEKPGPQKAVAMQPMPEKPSIPVTKSVKELLQPTGKTAPVEERATSSNKTKLPSKEELSGHKGASSGEFDFQPLASFTKQKYEARGLFIFDLDDDLYFDSINNEKFLEVSKSMMAADRSRVPESMYLRLGAQRFLQLTKFETNRGIFHVGLIVNSLLQENQLKELGREFAKLTN